MKPRIGIARALYSFYHFPLWRKFFEELDCKIVLSPPTTRKMLVDGVKIAPVEICLPIKAFLGHIALLSKEVDCILVPRMVCINPHRSAQPNKMCELKYGCPKAIGLPDMVKALFDNSTHILDLTIDERIMDQRQSFRKIGRLFSANNKKILQAWNSALIEQERYESLLLDGLRPSEIFSQDILEKNKSSTLHSFSDDAKYDSNVPRKRTQKNAEKIGLAQIESAKICVPKPQIGLIGHPYLIYDNLLSLSLFDTIEKLGVGIQSVSSVSNTTIDEEMKQISGVHWFYELDIIGSTAYFLKQKSIAGLLFAFSFSCGTSAVVSEIIREELLDFYDIPSITILFDEHTASAGLLTRVESFIDLLTRKPRAMSRL